MDEPNVAPTECEEIPIWEAPVVKTFDVASLTHGSKSPGSDGGGVSTAS